MRIDATTAVLGNHGAATAFEASRSAAHSAHAENDKVSLSALASGQVDQEVTRHMSGLIAANSSEALSVHGRLDPERAMRLVGLLD